jgi:hypothetical protein
MDLVSKINEINLELNAFKMYIILGYRCLYCDYTKTGYNNTFVLFISAEYLYALLIKIA